MYGVMSTSLVFDMTSKYNNPKIARRHFKALPGRLDDTKGLNTQRLATEIFQESRVRSMWKSVVVFCRLLRDCGDSLLSYSALITLCVCVFFSFKFCPKPSTLNLAPGTTLKVLNLAANVPEPRKHKHDKAEKSYEPS